MKLSDLKKNELNPRKISDSKKDLLRKSVEKFGDLGGIIYNVQTKRLVGGHQRSSVLPADATIKKEKLKEKSKTGTIAHGYVVIEGEKYSYREVDWDKQTEMEAMIAANKHQGSWDKDVLKLALAEVQDLEITGFDMNELGAMGITFEVPTIDVAPPAQAKEQTDEQYVRATEATTEQIETMNPNENQVKTFDDVKEKSEVEGKRYLIIVDCGSQEKKDEMREKIQPLVEGTEYKIF